VVERLLQFPRISQALPAKRPPPARTHDFFEVYQDLIAAKAQEQASRCSQCGVPFCQIHCPLQNHIPDWLKLTAEGRIEEAWELSQATNNMPEICGRICPQDRLCEGHCVIETAGHGTVTVGAIEKYLSEAAWENGWVKPLKPRRLINASVAVIGAGPAGLTAAEELRRVGYRVTIFDRHDRAGGLLTYGIPNFKLEKHVVVRRVQRLLEGGIVFRLNTEIGRDVTFGELRAEYDAVLIATGTYKPRSTDVPGVQLDRIVPALDYLIASNRKGFGDAVPDFDSGKLNARDRHVAVIGGGDTAMDCVRTAVRQGAKSVSCIYRRDRDNMPGSLREVANAEEEGVHFEWMTLPQKFLGIVNVEGVRLSRMRLGAADDSGRKVPEPIPGSDFKLESDLVIMALGFDPEDLRVMTNAPELALTRAGTVRVAPPALATNLDGVFAAGDVVRGTSLVVWAIKDGRDAALGIDQYLKSKAFAVREAAE
jgi:glutamate synthase (NADPH) small chain